MTSVIEQQTAGFSPVEHDASLTAEADAEAAEQARYVEGVRKLLLEANLSAEDLQRLRAVSAGYVESTTVLADEDFKGRDSRLSIAATQQGLAEYDSNVPCSSTGLSHGMSAYGIPAIHINGMPLPRVLLEDLYKFLPRTTESYGAMLERQDELECQMAAHYGAIAIGAANQPAEAHSGAVTVPNQAPSVEELAAGVLAEGKRITTKELIVIFGSQILSFVLPKHSASHSEQQVVPRSADPFSITGVTRQ